MKADGKDAIKDENGGNERKTEKVRIKGRQGKGKEIDTKRERKKERKKVKQKE
jgi:hypothetical protein